MTSHADLIERLTRAPRERWEEEYARHPVSMTRDDAHGIVTSAPPFADWFALRFDAGPPGLPLPSTEEAFQAVLVRHDGKAAHAFRVLFPPSALPSDTPDEVVLAVLSNSAGCALRAGTTYFAMWVVTRAGLAAIALGRPELAWRSLDGLKSVVGGDPRLGNLVLFEPIKGHPLLERSPWIRATICTLWPRFEVSAVPALRMPELTKADFEKLPETLRSLSEMGASTLHGLVQETFMGLAQESLLQQLINEVARAAIRLEERKPYTQRDVERALDGIEVPTLTPHMVALALDARVGALEALLLSLAIRRKVIGTGLEMEWRSRLAKAASDAIYRLVASHLFELRLQLLDEAIVAPHASLSRAELHWHRANMRLYLAFGDPEVMPGVVDELRHARELAWEEAEANRCAEITASWVRTLAQANLASDRETFDQAEIALARARELPLDQFAQATLHQAHGHLMRTRSVADAIPCFEAAVAILPAEERFRTEVAAELVDSLVRVDRLDDAIEVGLAAFKVAKEAGIELGMLQLALGVALVDSEQPDEAKVHLEAALDTLRPRDEHNALIARLQLARLGLVIGDERLVLEHLRFLQGRRADLPRWIADDLKALEASFASWKQAGPPPSLAARRGLQRITDLHQRIISLPKDQHDERRTLCAELEVLLDTALDVPQARLDLAAALRMDAAGNPALLVRAERHALRALAALKDLRAQELGHRTLGRIAIDRLRSAAPVSDPQQTEIAAFLLKAMPLPSHETAELRLAAASLLLFAGPLVHPTARETARQLIALAETVPSSAEKAAPLRARLEWVNNCAAAMTLVPKPHGILEGPFDDLPAWLVELVLGASPTTRPESSTENERWVEAALTSRPDVVDRIREWLGTAELMRPNVASSRAWSAFEQGVAALQAAHEAPHSPAASGHIEKSRSLLLEAVKIARERGLPELFDFLVSYGNSWRQRPGEDVAKSLAIYDEAERLDANPEQQAKLWKVKADALLVRGDPDDVRLAADLLDRSLLIRSGEVRIATLNSAALVALVHPDHDEHERQKRAAMYLLDAARSSPVHAEPLLEYLLQCLARWQHGRSDDVGPSLVRDELKAIYPARAAEVDAPVAVLSEEESRIMARSLEHPSSRAFMAVRRRLSSAMERTDHFGLMERVPLGVRKEIDERSQAESLIDRPDEMESLLASLNLDSGAGRPGVLTARVLLLARLARHGRRSVAEVRAATDAAIAELEGLDDEYVRSALLREIAVTWSPDDHSGDAVRDFELAARLLRQCLALEGGERFALNDTIGFLARALRYDTSGDPQANLRQSRRLYELAVERARKSGVADVLANSLHNLSEVLEQLAGGHGLEQLRASEAAIREALSLARSRNNKASLAASLAWTLTKIGFVMEGADRRRQFTKALSAFEQVEQALLTDRGRESFEHNRAVCTASLARENGGRRAEIEAWRDRIASFDGRTPPYVVATTRHNLANALLFGHDVNRAEFSEGMALIHQASLVRTVRIDARHAWETAVSAGRAIIAVLKANRSHIFASPPRAVMREAHTWLMRAVEAARALGPGEELADTALLLCELGVFADATEDLARQAEAAWTVLRQATGHVVIHPELREREAWTALHVAATLAHQLGRDKATSGGIAFVLENADAELVGRWLARAQGPVRRPLRARLSRPAGISPILWDDWRGALTSRNQRRIADALDRVRVVAADFLAEDTVTDSTWAWLEARPGSVAVAFMLAEPVSIALVLRIDQGGRPTTSVLGLNLAPSPGTLNKLASVMRDAVSNPAAETAHQEVARWLREGVAEPIKRHLKASPSVVLWSAGPTIRLISPRAIWEDTPAAVTSSFLLTAPASLPARPRSTLVALADPGPAAARELDLRDHGVPALERLAEAAALAGPVRWVASVGERSGRDVLGQRPEVRDSPASADDLLAEVVEHDVIVLIAHGQVEASDDAALICIDRAGKLDRLDVERLAREPNRFTGATLILLSCDSGRVGDRLTEPGGIAGTFLSVGARCVIAPLWPVRLDAAAEVGSAILRGLAAGHDLWGVLARLELDASPDSPTMGRRASTLSPRSGAPSLQRLAFVAWVG